MSAAPAVGRPRARRFHRGCWYLVERFGRLHLAQYLGRYELRVDGAAMCQVAFIEDWLTFQGYLRRLSPRRGSTSHPPPAVMDSLRSYKYAEAFGPRAYFALFIQV